MSKLPCGVVFNSGLGECCMENCPHTCISGLSRIERVLMIESCYQSCKEKNYPSWVVLSGRLEKKVVKSMIS